MSILGPCGRRFIAGAAIVLASSSPAGAQQTRIEEHAQEQAAKAEAVAGHRPNFVERAVRRVKAAGLFGSPRAGMYPQLTTVYPGGWVALGGGYRRPYGDDRAFDVSAAWSLRNFRKAEVSFGLPALMDGRLAFDLEGGIIDAPEVAFYGVGSDAPADHEVSFAYRPVTAGITANARWWRPLRLAAGVDYVAIDRVSSFQGPADITESLAASPGLGDGPRYVRTRGLVEIDWRRAPGYTGSGGLYRVELGDYADRGETGLGFRSVEAEVEQLVPILRANWVIALRGLITVTDARGGERVPFYLMPSLGGNSSVRGYPSLRFRGNHRVLLGAEYRWTAMRFLDMALFYDAGKVAMARDDLDLDDLRTSYGVGARFHGATRTVLRLEVARNDEGGWRFIWAAGNRF